MTDTLAAAPKLGPAARLSAACVILFNAIHGLALISKQQACWRRMQSCALNVCRQAHLVMVLRDSLRHQVAPEAGPILALQAGQPQQLGSVGLAGTLACLACRCAGSSSSQTLALAHALVGPGWTCCALSQPAELLMHPGNKCC